MNSQLINLCVVAGTGSLVTCDLASCLDFVQDTGIGCCDARRVIQIVQNVAVDHFLI